MLRIIHSQTVPGSLLVDDIDDGLPNKTAHRLGSTADPKAYVRDGYANVPKQSCYVPRTKVGNPLIPGYIDLKQTPRVVLSADKGKIAKMVAAGWCSVVTFNASNVVAPVISLADLGTPGAGDLTITGTNMLSLAPNTSSVIITGTGAITLTQAQITTGGGTFTNTSVFIPAALIPGVALATSSAKVFADDQTSNALALT